MPIERNCGTCKYVDVSQREAPCAGCRYDKNGSGRYTGAEYGGSKNPYPAWEPKAEAKAPLVGKARNIRKVEIRPGYLVRLSVCVRGGVSYKQEIVLAETKEANGAAVAKWETTRTVFDRDEFDRASALRAQIRNRLAGRCCRVGDFGLMVTAEDLPELEKAQGEAEAMAAAFNANAKTCRVDVSLLTGRIAESGEGAIRAIRNEVASLLAAVDAGVRTLDPEAIRKACNEARSAGQILTGEASDKLQEAINEAREAARDMAKRIKEGGQRAAADMARMKLETLDAARSLFLDVDTPPVTVPPVEFSGLDIDTEAPAAAAEPDPVEVKRVDTRPVRTGKTALVPDTKEIG